MRCFLCKTELQVAVLSVKTHFQPREDVDDRGNANFCEDCTTRLDRAIAESFRYPSRLYSHPVVEA